MLRFASVLLITLFLASPSWAQKAPPKREQALREGLADFQARLESLRAKHPDPSTDLERRLADVAVYGKAVEWCLEHDEFVKPDYVKQAETALATGNERLKQIADLPDERNAIAPWEHRPGTTILGYVSKVDDSVQPYALTLPRDFDPKRSQRWPLHVKLHGRANTMNEVNFVHRHDGKEAAEEQSWIQLDVYGRGNNAYRWAGETDVFEAIDDVMRRFRIDKRRVTLWGFSMGGAGAWHLGLHHPTKWSSVGAGAGFVDFYEYQKQTEKLPSWQDRTLGIYDAKDYALNAFNVPFVGYGGELDKQLRSGQIMAEQAERLDVPLKLIVGKGAGHKFTPEAFEEFMAFHAKAAERGRPAFPGRRELRFTTRTLKYNECGWLTIEEVMQQYAPATVEAKIDEAGDIRVTTKNVAILQISRDLASRIFIDDDPLPLASAADGLLPGVYYEKTGRGWFVLSYEDSKNFYDNADGRKRHDVQGPIDDAFTRSFVCVRGTGKPWSPANHAWAGWTLSRFEREWSKWMRGELPVVDDSEVDLTPPSEDAAAGADYGRNLVLFGDPGSNSVLAELLADLPIEWTEEKLVVDGVEYDPNTHGLSMIFPNPRDHRHYVVINSGHTFHEKDFKASNSWLFPRLGDIAVQRFEKRGEGYDETIVWAEIFNGGWRLPPKDLRAKP